MSNTAILLHGQAGGEEKILAEASLGVEKLRCAGSYFRAVPEAHQSRVYRLAEKNYSEENAKLFRSFVNFLAMFAHNWLLKWHATRIICRAHGYEVCETIQNVNVLNVVCLSHSGSVTWIGCNSMTSQGASVVYTPIEFRKDAVHHEGEGAQLLSAPRIGHGLHFLNFQPYMISTTIEMYCKAAPETSQSDTDGKAVSIATSTMFSHIDTHTLRSFEGYQGLDD